MNSQGFALSMEECRWLLEVNAVAAKFFWYELLRAMDGWLLEYLKAHGMESVLSSEFFLEGGLRVEGLDEAG